MIGADLLMPGGLRMAEPSERLGIGALAERAGVTPRTVRYYVAEGLLPPPGGTGQQRVYTHEHLLRLKAIRRLKEAYLPLGEIRHRLAGLSPGELQRLAEASPPPPGSALEYITAVLATPPAWPQVAAGPRGPAATPGPPRLMAEGRSGSRAIGQFPGPPEARWACRRAGHSWSRPAAGWPARSGRGSRRRPASWSATWRGPIGWAWSP